MMHNRLMGENRFPNPVMAGLVPAIHVFLRMGTTIDARHKAGHDQF